MIDADRIDSARPNEKFQLNRVDWAIALTRFEMRLSELSPKHDIDRIRGEISDDCCKKASGKQGIYTLTVPTGGGKTYASLRFALHHAKQHKLNHIIYIIPYTSIIEQNAKAIRTVIEPDNDAGTWVLEIHSNLEPENQTWRSKITAENWDAPIILTTMVQFLEVLFSDGTRGARCLHQLAHSVLIFDEIQTLPIKCVHLFCNALNFLTEHAKTTALLCTATQPLLNNLTNKHKGQLFIPKENELVEHVARRFSELKRVDIRDERKAKGWRAEEIVELALLELRSKNNCLIIVNTKSWAKTLYELCKPHLPSDALCHMSTNQCAAHRTECFDKIKHRLNQHLPIVCISTQLIEAGVDISFATVIRFLAGFDSIAQAAGRCNRHGELQQRGVVYVINPNEENIKSLPEIKVGCEMAQRVLDETKNHNRELLTPATIERYFNYYFYDRAAEMDYRLKEQQTTLFDLLAGNKNSILKTPTDGKWPLLRQSFMSAGKLFEVIDAPTRPVIVPYKRGRDLITGLCGVAKDFDQEKYFKLLRSAQRYTVNVFSNTWKELIDEKAVHEIQDEGIYYLEERYYSAEFGLATTAVAKMSLLIQ